MAAFCKAAMAASKVNPCTRKMLAAVLRPSPTIAASTMAPSISLRRPSAAAAAAASTWRKSSDNRRGAGSPAAARSSISPRWVDTSPVSCCIRTPEMANTSSASGSSVRASRRCSRLTSRCDCARAYSAALASVPARWRDRGMRPSESTMLIGVRPPSLASANDRDALRRGPRIFVRQRLNQAPPARTRRAAPAPVPIRRKCLSANHGEFRCDLRATRYKCARQERPSRRMRAPFRRVAIVCGTL